MGESPALLPLTKAPQTDQVEGSASPSTQDVEDIHLAECVERALRAAFYSPLGRIGVQVRAGSYIWCGECGVTI